MINEETLESEITRLRDNLLQNVMFNEMMLAPNQEISCEDVKSLLSCYKDACGLNSLIIFYNNSRSADTPAIDSTEDSVDYLGNLIIEVLKQGIKDDR